MSIDTTKLPPCAEIPDPAINGMLTNLAEFGEGLAKCWDEGNIANIRYVIKALVDRAETNCLQYGQNILNCRAEIVDRNKEIDRLRAG